jgi:tetratricopeptide (TPR) repeat protein
MRVNQNVEAANSYRVAVDATERIGFPSLPYNPARDHFKVGTLLRRAEAGIVLGNTECDLGRLKQANQTFHTTLAVLDGHMKPLSEATNGTVVFPETYWWYRIRVEVGQGNVAAASGDARKAEEFYRQALAEAGKHQDHPLIEEARIEVLNGLARVLESQGRTAEAEHAYGEVRRALKSVAEKDPGWSWRLAWFLVTCPDAKFRDPPQAVELARQTTERAERNKSKHSNAYLTLGAALYRMGDGKAALAELAHARPGPHKAFFMAMVYHQLGDKKQARYAYDVGVRVMDANAPYDDELRRFRGEAAQLLGIESSKDRK